MESVPVVNIRYSDSYKQAIVDIFDTLKKFKSMDDLYDPYMVENTIRETFNNDENSESVDDFDLNLNSESLYINISHLECFASCKPSVLSMLEYAFKDQPMSLFFYTTNDDKLLAFVELPLKYIADNARHY
jgi:hypothetical protein